jgi:hypothetical protein
MSDVIRSRPANQAYRDGWDRIFGQKTVLEELVEETEKLGGYEFDAGYSDAISGRPPASLSSNFYMSGFKKGIEVEQERST